MSLREILTDYSSLLNDFSERLLDKVFKRIERSIYSAIETYLDNFNVKDGKFSSRKTNSTLLLEIDKVIKRSYFDSGIRDDVDGLYKEFDLVEKLTKEYYRRLLKKPDQKDITELFKVLRPLKAALLDDITTSLLDYDSVKLSVIKGVKDDIFSAVIFKSSVKDLKKTIRSRLITPGDVKTSKLFKNAHLIAHESIMRYDGAIHQSAMNKFKFNGFMISPLNLTKTSRKTCIHMVNGTGPMEKYAVRPGVYRSQDMKKIIKENENNPGWIIGTDVNNYAVRRNGYNCNHSIIGVPLLDDEIDSVELRDIISG